MNWEELNWNEDGAGDKQGNKEEGWWNQRSKRAVHIHALVQPLAAGFEADTYVPVEPKTEVQVLAGKAWVPSLAGRFAVAATPCLPAGSVGKEEMAVIVNRRTRS